MTDCISQGYKDMLAGLLKADLGKEALEAVIKVLVPCETIATIQELKKSVQARPVEKAERARQMSERWPSARYFNDKGGVEDYDSPSKLYTTLTGKGVSGQVCTEDGKDCRALSLVDNFRIHGFTVMGNGEAPPPSPADGKESEIKRAHQAWKQHLLDTGKKFMVFHPESPALKEMQAKHE